MADAFAPPGIGYHGNDTTSLETKIGNIFIRHKFVSSNCQLKSHCSRVFAKKNNRSLTFVLLGLHETRLMAIPQTMLPLILFLFVSTTHIFLTFLLVLIQPSSLSQNRSRQTLVPIKYITTLYRCPHILRTCFLFITTLQTSS
jgi:hypothetical protein